MKRCVIIGAADVCKTDLPQKNDSDLWIAADGGSDTLKKFGMSADMFIGDKDSSEGPCEEGQSIILPRRKDDTDSAAAVKYALSAGYDHITLLGALGGDRLSHTVANIQLLSFIRQCGSYGELISGKIRVVCMIEGEKIIFNLKKGYFSLFSLNGKSTVDIKGAQFDGTGIELDSSFPLGVSNETTEQTEISVTSGKVLCITEFDD